MTDPWPTKEDLQFGILTTIITLAVIAAMTAVALWTR